MPRVLWRGMPATWDEARGEKLRALRNLRGVSQGDLAYEVRSTYRRKLTGSAIGQFERGENGPSFPVLEAMLTVLEADEAEWPELTLGRARRMLDEREVGYDEALRNLSRIYAALDIGGARDDADERATPTDFPLGPAAHLFGEEPQPTQESSAPNRKKRAAGRRRRTA